MRKSQTEAAPIIKQMLDEFNRMTEHDSAYLADAIMFAAKQAGFNASVENQTVTIGGVQSNPSLGFIDLKPAFQNSAKVKYSKSAHDWYMVIPIRRKVKSMNNNLYKRARQIELNTTEYLDNLLEERQPVTSPFGIIPANFNYNTGEQKLGGNLTRVPNNRGRGSSYIAFRTVSAKSPVNSWILRYKKDTSSEDLKILEAIIDKVVGS